MDKLILMYHSVDSAEHPAVAGAFPFPFERFKAQVQRAVDAGYRPERISRLHHPHPDKTLYVTSDDGTVDWCRNALPWCEAKGIPTHTAIITGPWEATPVYPLAHIIQLILTSRPQHELEALAQRLHRDHLDAAQLAYIEGKYHYETLFYRRVIKGAFNLVFERDQAYEALGELTASEHAQLRARFARPEAYQPFALAELGVHTRSHWALDQDTQRYFDDEIQQSRQTMIDAGVRPGRVYTSPMQPRFGARLEDLQPLLQEAGYQGVMTSNPGVWNQKDFIIPRIDAARVEAHLDAVDAPPSA